MYFNYCETLLELFYTIREALFIKIDTTFYSIADGEGIIISEDKPPGRWLLSDKGYQEVYFEARDKAEELSQKPIPNLNPTPSAGLRELMEWMRKQVCVDTDENEDLEPIDMRLFDESFFSSTNDLYEAIEAYDNLSDLEKSFHGREIDQFKKAKKCAFKLRKQNNNLPSLKDVKDFDGLKDWCIDAAEIIREQAAKESTGELAAKTKVVEKLIKKPSRPQITAWNSYRWVIQERPNLLPQKKNEADKSPSRWYSQEMYEYMKENSPFYNNHPTKPTPIVAYDAWTRYLRAYEAWREVSKRAIRPIVTNL